MKFEYQKIVFIRNFDKEFEFLTQSIREMHLPSGFSDFILYAISELFANIKEHAQVNKGLITLQIKNRKCYLKIKDEGIGLKKSYLKKGIFVKDDFSAIEFALSGLSTKSPQERGFGLYSVKKLTNAIKGTLIITTGTAKAIIQKNKINFKTISPFKGTIIEINTPIKKLDFYQLIT